MLQFLISLVKEAISLIWFAICVAIIFIKTKYLYWTNSGILMFPFNILSLSKYTEMITMEKSAGEVYKQIYDSVPETVNVVQIYKGMMIKNTDLVRQIIHRDERTMEKAIVNQNLKEIFDLPPADWINLLKNMSKSFKEQNQEALFSNMKEIAQDLHEHLTAQIEIRGDENNIYDFREICMKYTIDIINYCVFLRRANCFARGSKLFFQKVLTNIRTIYLYRRIEYTSTFFMVLILKYTRLEKIRNLAINYAKAKTYFAIGRPERPEEEKRNLYHVSTIIDSTPYLLNGLNYPTSEADKHNLTSETAVCFTAGYGHGCNTILFALYELALNVNVQATLRKEIHEMINGEVKHITYNSVEKMKYLKMVIAETLRKYPPVPYQSHISEHAHQNPYLVPYERVYLPEGSRYYLSTLGIQMDAKYYPEPERFQPERFEAVEVGYRPNHLFFPFGNKNSAQLVSAFCNLQTKLGLIYILKDHKIEICTDTPIPLKIDPLCEHTKPLGDVKMSLTKLPL